MKTISVGSTKAVGLAAAVLALNSLGFKRGLRWLREIRWHPGSQEPSSMVVFYTFWIRGKPYQSYVIEVRLDRREGVSAESGSSWVPVCAWGYQPAEEGGGEMRFEYDRQGEISRSSGTFPYPR